MNTNMLTQDKIDQINKNFKYNNISILKKELENSIDLTDLTPTEAMTKNSFGSAVSTLHYDIGRSTKVGEIQALCRKLASDLEKELPGYTYHVLSKRVEIYNKERNNLTKVSFKLSINHENQTIYNTMILA